MSLCKKNQDQPLTVLFVAVDMVGHLNPCIAVAEQLVASGHRAVFALERSWQGQIAGRYKNLEEVLYTDPTRDPCLQANDFWIENTKLILGTFPLEGVQKVAASNPDIWLKLLHILLNVDDQLVEIIQNRVQPDVIVVDTFATVPAVWHSGLPWVRSFSAAPLSFVRSDDLPPPGSGLPISGDRKEWQAYRDAGKPVMGNRMEVFFQMMTEKYGIPPPPAGRSGHISPYLNWYCYPEELDYLDYRPLPPTFMRLDHLVRQTELKKLASSDSSSFLLPRHFINGPGKLVYVSLGSVGSTDLLLMKRLISLLAASPNQFIFSLGPHWEELTPLLDPQKMTGARFLPQTTVLPMVNLFISHGGNNSVLEALYAGVPMLICPLFAEQPENAQRVTETAYGLRFNAYTCTKEELVNKIEHLLSDNQLRERLEKMSSKMKQSQNSAAKAAAAVIAVARNIDGKKQ